METLFSAALVSTGLAAVPLRPADAAIRAQGDEEGPLEPSCEGSFELEADAEDDGLDEKVSAEPGVREEALAVLPWVDGVSARNPSRRRALSRAAGGASLKRS